MERLSEFLTTGHRPLITLLLCCEYRYGPSSKAYRFGAGGNPDIKLLSLDAAAYVGNQVGSAV